MKRVFALVLMASVLLASGSAVAESEADKETREVMAGAFIEGFTAGSQIVVSGSLIHLGECKRGKEALRKAKKIVSEWSELSPEAPETFLQYKELIAYADKAYRNKCIK